MISHRSRFVATALAGMTVLSAPAIHAAPPVVASAPAVSPPAAPAPKLVVAVSVDQFSADLFAQYRQHYTAVSPG
jgi:predicted AlkP superfamily pyrophosphatase or phosphodiesterase